MVFLYKTHKSFVGFSSHSSIIIIISLLLLLFVGLFGFGSNSDTSFICAAIMGVAVKSHQFHVLAVDDSNIDRKLIERLLKTSYQVTAVDSVSKALEFLGLHEDGHGDADFPSVSPNNLNQYLEVNLIITDYSMPGMTGYDLLRKIKESKSLRDIPVVIMSSENIPSRINRCLEEGAEDFFLKPVQMTDVSKLRPHMLKV